MAIYQLQLLNDKGESLRVFSSDSKINLLAVYEKSTLRLLLIEEKEFDEDQFTLIQKIEKGGIQGPIKLKGVGILAPLITSARWLSDVSLKAEDDETPKAILKYNSIVHGVVSGLLLIIALFFPIKNTVIPNEEEIIKIDIKSLLNDQKMVQEIEKKAIHEKKAIVPMKKQIVRVAPRKDKTKSLIVKQSQSVPQKGVKIKTRSSAIQTKEVTSFQRMGSLGVLSQSMKGTANGFGSGLRSADGSTGGWGRGAGSGKGNGTRGRGSDSGGGYAQALYGKGMIAAQVGAGGDGFGSGHGNGRVGDGGYGTKDKKKIGAGGVGHEGIGNGGKLGAGSSVFILPVVEEAMVEGGLDEEQVEQIVARNKGQIAYCYELGLQRNSSLKGRVTSHFEIGPRGNVVVSKIAGSSIKSSIVEDCIANKVKNWKFPNPVGGVQVSVNYPFMLQRVTQN
jgi:hypothetical protein